VRRRSVERTKLFVLATVLALAGAACGGGEKATDGAPPAAGGNKVDMNDNLKFVPASLSVKVGTEVTWVNVGSEPHTVSSTSDTPIEKTVESGNIDGDGTFKYTFNTTGEFKYFCKIHGSGMSGTVTVT
jgi:plastocyanin